MNGQLSFDDVIGTFDYAAKSTAGKFLKSKGKQKKKLNGEMFDISKAHVKYKPGRVGFVDIIAMIPNDVKNADELPRKTDADERFDMFIDFTTAIWRYNRSENKSFNWEAAEKLCKESRDRQVPVVMRIYIKEEFKPQYVTKYLK